MTDVRRRKSAEAFSPGEYLKDFLTSRGWSQTDLADVLGRPPRLINEIIAGKRAITPETALGLAAAFGNEATFWMNLETEYQLRREQGRDREPVARRARIYAKLPLNHVLRRGWITPTSDLDLLERRVCEFLHIENIDQEPRFFAHSAKKSTPYDETTQLQTAWLFRSRAVAESMTDLPEYTAEKLADAIQQLRVLLRNAENVRRVPRILHQAGIRFVVVEPLPGSGMDGASFWLDERQSKPAIAMSIRFDRIDNFWFVLMHELGHLFHRHGGSADHHLEKSVDEDALPDEERQASQFASEQLVPRGELMHFIARTEPYFSAQSILTFAAALDLHPSLVVGQLQHRGKVGYSSFRPMLVPIRDSVVSVSVADGWGSTVSL